MCSAWTISRPRPSKMATEQSARSLMLLEYAVRIRLAATSSLAAIRALPTTSRVIGSTPGPAMSLRLRGSSPTVIRMLP